MKDLMIDAGEEVVKATAELNSTVDAAVLATEETEMDQDEVQSWLTTIFKALVAAIKP